VKLPTKHPGPEKYGNPGKLENQDSAKVEDKIIL
jgi:hypothetical protein